MDYFDFNMQLTGLETQSDTGGTTAMQDGLTERTPVVTPMEHPRDANRTIVSVSTTFHWNMLNDNLLPDLIIISSDHVHFHVHLHRVLSASENGFNYMLPLPVEANQEESLSRITVSENAEVLNVVIHTVYDLSCAHFLPSLETSAAALTAMVKYGLPPQRFAVPSSSLFHLLLSYAPVQPIEAYVLAATHDLYDLAVAISSHLLSFPLASLSDELATRIGPLYLKRLFFLHHGRMEALKVLLLHPPRGHAETPNCNSDQQRKLTRAWALTSAHLVWDTRPNISTSMLQSTFRLLENDITCPMCKRALQDRILQLVSEWAAVKRTI